jgi:tetratricopeptide (TPR) repeat protein
VIPCGLLAFSARAQLPYWRSSRPLFERALAVTGPNPAIHRELGLLLARAGDPAGALPHFEEAAALAPGWSTAQHLGGVLVTLGRPEQALPHLERSVADGPERANARAALGAVLLKLGRAEEAREQLERATRLEPSAKYLALLAEAEASTGRLDAAIESQRRAVASAEAARTPDVARLRARLDQLTAKAEPARPQP